MASLETRTLEGEAGFKVLFDCATIGILVVGMEGTIELANPCAETLFSYNVAELIGKPIEILIPDHFHQKHSHHREGYFNHPKARPMGLGLELFAKKKDGQVFPVEISLGHYELDGENLAVAFVTDITERKLAQQKSLQQNERYLHLFQGIWEAFIVQEAVMNDAGEIIDLRFLEVNPAAEKMLGRTSDRLIGFLRSEIQGPLDQQALDLVNLVLRQHERVKTERFVPDINRWFEVTSYSPLSGQIATLSMDITDRKQVEEELRNLNGNLEAMVKEQTIELIESIEREKELSEMKSRFVSMASHEFRTPLSALLSSAALAQQYLDRGELEKAKKHIERIKGSVKNLNDILNDFLSLDKLEQGKVEVVFLNFDLQQFAKEIVEEMEGLLKQEQQISFTYDGDIQINQDKHILRNIIINLLSNASKYSNEGEIEFRIFVSDGIAKMHVKDNGIGIPEEQQKEIFTRFFRANNTNNVAGTGLGLNIVKRYVELLDGSIQFYSKVGEGTTFVVEMPSSTNQ